MNLRTTAHPNDRWFMRGEERDPLGAGLPDDLPNANYVGLAEEKVYQESGNPLDLADGCVLDGIQMSCSQVNSLINAGSAKSRVEYYNGDRLVQRFGEIRSLTWGTHLVWIPGNLLDLSHDDEDDGEVVRVWSDETHGIWMGLPQNTYLTKDQIEGLRTDLNDMLANPGCAKFAKALLNQLGNSHSDNPVNLFNKVETQGGFYQISFPPWGEAPGTVGGGNAAIGIVLLKANQTAAIFHNNLARTLFHELVHGSTNSRNSVGHPEMAQAAYAVATAQGYKNVLKPPQPGSNDYDYQTSVYFEARVFAACGPRSGGKKR